MWEEYHFVLYVDTVINNGSRGNTLYSSTLLGFCHVLSVKTLLMPLPYVQLFFSVIIFLFFIFHFFAGNPKTQPIEA